MTDKRTLKTKRNLKGTLTQMLRTIPFEKITVSELCRTGETSRITFYTYYEDKYALVNELFMDYVAEAVSNYRQMQAQNNPDKEALQGYYNMLDCILNLYYNNLEFFSLASSKRNPYLYSTFYRYIFQSVEDYVEQHDRLMKAKYSARQTAALLCNGLWGVINECYDSETPQQQLRNDVKAMYRDILLAIFTFPETKKA